MAEEGAPAAHLPRVPCGLADIGGGPRAGHGPGEEQLRLGLHLSLRRPPYLVHGAQGGIYSLTTGWAPAARHVGTFLCTAVAHVCAHTITQQHTHVCSNAHPPRP